MKQTKHPCIGCIYFKACGETTRTMPCEGRMTKSQKKKEKHMKEVELKHEYTEIQKLFDYCIKLGINARLEKMYDGYAIRFPSGHDFVQHMGSYGSCMGCVEPAIFSKRDYTAVPLKNAKSLVKRNKDRLNRRYDQ